MRFDEFRILEAEQPGYYTVGDSHAVGMANYAGRPWVNKGKNGTSARASMHTRAIDSIPAGSVVVISAGANDTFARNPNPASIASSVKGLVDRAKAKGLTVGYLLFPVGTKDNKEAREETRAAIKSALSGVTIFDLEGSRLVDGVHADASAYRSAANSFRSSLSAPAATRNPAATREPSAESLEAGPPYPPEQKDAVKAMQEKLKELGYSIGSTGTDGKYGPRTTRAVRAFKKDYNIAGDGLSINSAGLKKLDDVISGKIPRVQTPTQIDTRGPDRELGPLAQDSVTQGKVGALLDFIARPESGGRYDAVYPGRRRPEILDMTIEELFQDMRQRGRSTGSSASGRYQYIRKTLQGLVRSMDIDPSRTKFDKETQDRIVIYHLRKDHGLDKWLAGRMSTERFLDRLSRTWAGLPNPGRGGSFYAGVLDNRAGMGVRTALANLDQIQSTV